jgi:hypothetical protein
MCPTVQSDGLVLAVLDLHSDDLQAKKSAVIGTMEGQYPKDAVDLEMALMLIVNDDFRRLRRGSQFRRVTINGIEPMAMLESCGIISAPKQYRQAIPAAVSDRFLFLF